MDLKVIAHGLKHGMLKKNMHFPAENLPELIQFFSTWKDHANLIKCVLKMELAQLPWLTSKKLLEQKLEKNPNFSQISISDIHDFYSLLMDIQTNLPYHL